MRLLSFMLGISWKEKHGGIFPEGAQLRDRTASSACNNLASDCQFSSSNIKQYKHGSVERGWGWGEINGVNFCLEITFITSVTLKLGPVRYDNQEQKPLSFFFFFGDAPKTLFIFDLSTFDPVQRRWLWGFCRQVKRTDWQLTLQGLLIWPDWFL